MRLLITAAFTLLITIATPVLANDGAAGIDGGQLVFKNLKGVDMLEEYLVLSPDLVTVRYVFRNKTAKDITTHVAFPIAYPMDTDTTFDTKLTNPNGFFVSVNGQKKTFSTESKSTDGEFRTTHFWEQTFPANKNIIIEHQYKPLFDSSVVEQMVKTPAKDGSFNEDIQSYYANFEKNYCLSAKQRKQMEKNRYTFNVLNYILTTANTWDGPIGTFKLTIKKNTRKFLFLCTKLVLKKNSKGDFETTVKSYRPMTDLSIAFTDK